MRTEGAAAFEVLSSRHLPLVQPIGMCLKVIVPICSPRFNSFNITPQICTALGHGKLLGTHTIEQFHNNYQDSSWHLTYGWHTILWDTERQLLKKATHFHNKKKCIPLRKQHLMHKAEDTGYNITCNLTLTALCSKFPSSFGRLNNFDQPSFRLWACWRHIKHCIVPWWKRRNFNMYGQKKRTSAHPCVFFGSYVLKVSPFPPWTKTNSPNFLPCCVVPCIFCLTLNIHMMWLCCLTTIDALQHRTIYLSSTAVVSIAATLIYWSPHIQGWNDGKLVHSLHRKCTISFLKRCLHWKVKDFDKMSWNVLKQAMQ